MPTAVYVWYPHEGHIGHSSMHIGQHREQDSDEWYVSWWPHKSTFLATRRGESSTFREDKDTEGGPPHVKYVIFDGQANLHCGNMKAEWDAVKGKQGSHYKLIAKNCATTVARVLRAGGLQAIIGDAAMKKVGTNLIWSPKAVAKLCEQLVGQGLARKEKHHTCPLKSQDIGHVILGLR